MLFRALALLALGNALFSAARGQTPQRLVRSSQPLVASSQQFGAECVGVNRIGPELAFDENFAVPWQDDGALGRYRVKIRSVVSGADRDPRPHFRRASFLSRGFPP